CGEGRVAHGLVVEARREDEIAPEAAEGRRHDVHERQIPAEDGLGIDPERLAEELAEGADAGLLAAARRGEGHERREVLLRVELEPVLAELAVEVDGGRGDAGGRAIGADEAAREGRARAGTAELDAAGEAEVAVEPGVV